VEEAKKASVIESFMVCKRCESTTYKVRQNGPHMELRCNQCERYIKFINPAELQRITVKKRTKEASELLFPQLKSPVLEIAERGIMTKHELKAVQAMARSRTRKLQAMDQDARTSASFSPALAVDP
jgi:tRNA G26 N,N-dimethylase Trm1